MKLVACVILTISSFTLLAQKPMQYVKTKASISGVATGTTDDQPNSKTVPLSRASFKVVEGKLYKGQLPVSSFVTDDKGNFYLSLPVGVYCIVEEDRPEVFTLKKSTTKEKWDNRCRKKQWQTPLLVLTVSSNDSRKIELDRHLPSEALCLKK